IVSPGSSVRFVAKSITRVRSSWLKATGVVGLNGSASRLIDSNASARVELVFVSNTGAVASRAFLGANNAMQNRESMKIKTTRRPIVRPRKISISVEVRAMRERSKNTPKVIGCALLSQEFLVQALN